MINVRFKLFILTAFVLLSCKGEHGITVPVHEVDYLNRSESVIHGSLVPQEFIGANTFTLFDTLLMVMSNNPAGLLSVYSTNTLSHWVHSVKKAGPEMSSSQMSLSVAGRLTLRTVM